MTVRCAVLAASLWGGVVPQAATAQVLAGGVKIGVASTRIAGFNRPDWRSRVSPTFGAILRLRIRNALSIQFEGFYAKKGADFGDSASGLRIDYLEMPVLLRLASRTDTSGTGIAVLLGFALSREVGCRLRYYTGSNVASAMEATGFVANHDCIERRSDAIDYGVVGAVELEGLLPLGRISVELRYTYGLANVASEFSGWAVRNRSVALLFGYAIAVLR